MADTASRQEALAAKRQKQKEREEKWVETQIIGFSSWINSFVTKRGKKVETLETAFRDGLMLVDFLELAAGAKLEGIDKHPKGKIHSLQNLSICLRFVMDGLKVRLLGINAATIYDGNLKLILGMIWSIFRCPKITNIDLGDDADSKKGKKSFESNLLAWVRERVANYGLSVTDFKSSFNDGQVFAALIHSIVPESLDFETISPANPANNLETAFGAALKSLQVPCLLSVEDMIAGQPDERSVVLYTSLLFHAWTALGAKAVDNQIHAKLQREKEQKEKMKDELAALKSEIAAAQNALSQRALNSHGLSEENERLRKLLEALQKKSRVADDIIHSLEAKVGTLNQLGGDADKKFFRSRSGHRDFLAAGADGKGLVGSSTPNDSTSSWFVKPKLGKGAEGKVTIVHADTGKALASGAGKGKEEEGKEEGSGEPVLVADEDSAEAEWTLVSGPDGGSALQNTKTGEFLQLGEDGKVSFVTDKIAVFDILSKSEMDDQVMRARESARLAESFKRSGKTVQIQHMAGKDFVVAGHGGVPSLSSTLGDSSDWELVLNVDGSVCFRNVRADCFLNDDGGHISLGDTCTAKADFWFEKSENDGGLIMRNKATGDCVTHGGQKLVTSDGKNEEQAVWSLVPRDPELATSLAGSLAQAGGNSLLRNALSRGFVNSTPEISEAVGEDTEWEITATDDGHLVFKSKDNEQYLSSSAKGSLGMSEGSSPSSQWNVSRGADGDLLLQNCETGEFLSQGGDGALSCASSSQYENSSWIVKSEDGSFSSSGRSVGDADLGRRVAAGLDASGGNGLIKHSATQQFANNKAELSADKDSDMSKWNVSAKPDGSLIFKSKENGQVLIQAQDGSLALSEEGEGPKGSWGVSMGADGSLEIRNKATGNYLQKNLEGGDLSVSSLPHGENSKWDIESDNGAFSSRGLGVTDPSLAAAIGAGLSVAGGAALVQHASQGEFLSNAPGLSAAVGENCHWDITSNDNGTITLKDKSSGQLLFQKADGSLSLSDAKSDVAGSQWGVTKSKDGDLLIRSTLNGNFLLRGDKGELVSSDVQLGEKSGWVIKSENGLFSSRRVVVGGKRSVGKALAAALAAHGGIGHVQNGSSNDYIDGKPGMSAKKCALIDWEIVADENGSVALKSKTSGEYLSEGNGGKLEMTKHGNHASSLWNVKENNGNLVFRNNATENFLVQQPDGTLGCVHSPEGTNEGWKVKSADGAFTSDSNFADFDMEEGFFMGEGFSMKDLEERNARLNREIQDALDKVDKEKRRREEFAKRMGNLEEMGDDNEQRYQELSKTISELEEKADQLQKLFDAEKHRKRQQDEAKAAAERELLEREAILRDAMERRERVLKKLDKSKSSAKKEITKRKQREKEIQQLEAMKKQLQQRVAMSERTKVGLESLKRGLEDHLQDLSVWRGHQQMDRQMNDFDLKKISHDLEGMPLEQQMDYLDGMLQEENRCLQRISKAQGVAQPSESKILKKGTLSLFGKKEWRPRLCVLSGQNLEYYGNDDVKIGVVDLAMGCDVVRLKAIKDGKTKVWPLKLSINTKVKGEEEGEQQQVVKKLFLRAATKAERQSWFTAVSSATSRINYRAETESSGEKIDPRIFSFISAGEDTPIYELFVDFRPISSAGINALRKGILYHDELHTLSLQQGQISDEGLAKLTPSLDRLPNLRVVRLSGNRLTSEAVTAALKALAVQTTGLQEIDLSNNIIGVEAVDALAALLKLNPKVNFLNLSGNVLGDDGAVALAKVLSETQTAVPALEVNNNKIGDRGALALTEMANANLNIGSILLSGNRVSDEGAVGMADLLRDNVNITNLDLSGNNIGAKGAQAFRDCLLDNIDLHVVNLSSNPLLCDDEQLAGMLHVEGFAVASLSFVRGKSVKVAASAEAAAAEPEEEEGEE